MALEPQEQPKGKNLLISEFKKHNLLNFLSVKDGHANSNQVKLDALAKDDFSDIAYLPQSQRWPDYVSWKNISSSIIFSVNPKDPFFLKAFKSKDKKFQLIHEHKTNTHTYDDIDVYYQLEKKRLQDDLRTKLYDLGRQSKKRKDTLRTVSRIATKVSKIEKALISNKILFSKKLSEPTLKHLDIAKINFNTEHALDRRRFSGCSAISGGKIQKDNIFLASIKKLPKAIKSEENLLIDESRLQGRSRGGTSDSLSRKISGTIFFGMDEKMRKQKRIQSINKAYKKVTVINKFKSLSQEDLFKRKNDLKIKEEIEIISPVSIRKKNMMAEKLINSPLSIQVGMPQSYLFRKKFSSNNHSIAQSIFHSRNSSLASLEFAKSNRNSFLANTPLDGKSRVSLEHFFKKNPNKIESVATSKKVYENSQYKLKKGFKILVARKQKKQQI